METDSYFRQPSLDDRLVVPSGEFAAALGLRARSELIETSEVHKDGRMKRFSWLLACVVLACTPEVSKPARFVARHDALSSGVVISEVYGGAAGTGATYRHDFVELFNRGTAPVDVSGWSVQYTSDTGGSWQPTSLAGFAGPLQPGSSCWCDWPRAARALRCRRTT